MYEHVDNAILAAIKAGKCRFIDIQISANSALSPKRYDERAIDRRLQSLRRRKVIKYTGHATGWTFI